MLTKFINFADGDTKRRKMKIRKYWVAVLTAVLAAAGARAEYSFTAGAELNLGYGSNDFAPYYLHTNRFGKLTQAKNVQMDLWAIDTLDLSKRFDFAWGVEALAGYANKTDYDLWDAETKSWVPNPQGPAEVWLQQLFAEVKWRCLYLSVGIKDRPSSFVNQRLSSGDLIWSGNSRSIPEARIGFVDFQDIPLTKKWVQIDACISYGKFIDTDWINNHFSYWNGKRNPGGYYTYKRLALRTNPEKPFSFQAGIQMTTIFGGMTFKYADGKLISTTDNYNGFKDFVQVLLPFWTSEREGYRVGDARGSWDFSARYRFKTGETLRAYVQWPWEDSSGIPKKNGFDGLWGLEFKTGRKWWINGVVVEYLDMTHMSGPVLYDPAHSSSDNKLPHLTGGRDGYYNNYYYRSYVNYGLNMGTPMVQGTLFYKGDNKYATNDGWLNYFRPRAIHVAVEGSLSDCVDYIFKYSHRKAWGDSNTYALVHPVEADSFMAGASWTITAVPGLSLTGALAVDYGSMPTKGVGGLLTLTYERPFVFGRRNR